MFTLSPSTIGSAPFGYLRALVDALEPAGEVERTPGHALADAFGDQRLHAAGLAAFHLGAGHQDPGAVLDAALGGIGRIDLDEHVLLQLGEPLVGSRFLAAALVFDQTAGREDQRELLGDALVDRRLLHREADIRHTELLGVGQRRIFRDQLRPRRVDRLAVHRDGVGQAERVGARLAVAVGDAAVLDGDALDAARQIDRPGHRIRRGRVDLVDHRQFGLGQVLVPAELLEHAVA